MSAHAPKYRRRYGYDAGNISLLCHITEGRYLECRIPYFMTCQNDASAGRRAVARRQAAPTYWPMSLHMHAMMRAARSIPCSQSMKRRQGRHAASRVEVNTRRNSMMSRPSPAAATCWLMSFARQAYSRARYHTTVESSSMVHAHRRAISAHWLPRVYDTPLVAPPISRLFTCRA